MGKLKFCTKCETSKELQYFHKDKYSKDGYTGHCKDCRNTHHQEYREKTDNEKDKQYKNDKRSNQAYRKLEYKKHTEWGRKNAKKLAEQERIRRSKETIEQRQLRINKMRIRGRKYKFKNKINKILLQ